MRRFRFVGNTSMFDWDQKPVVGDVYPETHYGTKNGVPWRQTFADGVDANNWQEVFDEPKNLHKDTDLGYFAGLAMQGLIANAPDQQLHNTTQGCELAIWWAKELIKQLNEETK